MKKCISNDVYPVRFGDLVKELSKLCNMDYKKDMIGFYLTTSVCFYGMYNLDEMIELMNDKKFNFRYGHDYLHVIMYGKKNSKYAFFYNFKLNLNYNELQSDGKKLKDYLTSKYDYGYFNCSSIVVNDDIDNLVLYFNDEVLNKNKSIDFFPDDLLKTAVNNCYKKVKTKKNI